MVFALYVLVTPSVQVNNASIARLGAEHAKMQVPVRGYLVLNVRMAGSVNLMTHFVHHVLQDAVIVHLR